MCSLNDSRCECMITVSRVESIVQEDNPMSGGLQNIVPPPTLTARRVYTSVFDVRGEDTLAGRRGVWGVNNLQEADFVMSHVVIKLLLRIGLKIGCETRGTGMLPLRDSNHFDAITSGLAQTNNMSEGKMNFFSFVGARGGEINTR